MASGQSRQREALRPLERVVEALKEAMVGRQHEEGGAGQLRVLHGVLAEFAAVDGAQSDQLSLHECAEAVAGAIFGWLEALNALRFQTMMMWPAGAAGWGTGWAPGSAVGCILSTQCRFERGCPAASGMAARLEFSCPRDG